MTNADSSVAEMLNEIPSALHACVLGLLEHDGWTVGMQPDRPTDVRKRLVAHHDSGTSLLVISRPSQYAGGTQAKWRARNNRYFVRRGADGPWWRVDGFQATATFMGTRKTDPDHMQEHEDTDPLDTPNGRTRRVCSCAKRQFSRTKADRVLVEAKVKRSLRGDERRRECRSYRCEDDPRVWHLTSRESWRA
ncbi:hypothetical protein [Streptomyces sp. sk226]|uniref:hypothetical protein n=1 Tax=Streptomyces sp. sk226 TaxID=2034268 RepID=UPI001185A1CA|nr:hypothetical protein [Streptomyces sp. sk226]